MKKMTLIFAFFGLMFSVSAMASGYTTAYDQTTAMRRCYNQDNFGQPYGYPLNDRYCHVSYGTDMNQYGMRVCYNTDNFGRTYGYSVNDRYCHVSYRTAPDQYGNRRCYNSDNFGRAYGYPVSDHLCN